MNRILLLAVLALAIATHAFAGAVEDGNAGLDALNRGAYDDAIRLFTRAIKSGQLAGDDKEFAYLNRGKAYLGAHRYGEAAADLRAAIAIKPNDSEAQDALAQAQTGHDTGPSTAARPVDPSQAWGILASLAGRYFWYQQQGHTPHEEIIRYDWLAPQQVLRYVVRSKDSTIAVGEYKLDPATGKLIEATAMSGGVFYGTATASPSSLTEYFYVNNIPARGFMTSAGSGLLNTRSQNFVNGAWQTAALVQFIEASEAEAVNGGFFKKR